jgi:23S rRNA pseudouridine1911/1915/1917 synthase
MRLNVLYEDNHLLGIEKLVNVPVQADSSGDADLLNAAKAYIKQKYNKPGAVYLGLVHRLDRPVGGAMVFARTSKAAVRLQASMQRGEWQKTYLAVVEGDAPEAGTLTDYIAREGPTAYIAPAGAPGAKRAGLAYERRAQKDGLSLLQVTLHTGRHHQIRVQLMHAGLPIWGDARYNPAARPGQQIALYATELCFAHPVTKEPVTLCARPHLPPFTAFGF